MKAVLITLVILGWLLSLVLNWINCRQRERLAERADDLEKKVAALKGQKDEHESGTATEARR